MSHQIKPKIYGYRTACGPGDFHFHGPALLSLLIDRQDYDVWALYDHPQSDCDPEIAVYLGTYWVQPKYAFGDLSKFTALYVGPLIYQMAITEEFALRNPGFMEARLQQQNPQLYKKGG